MASAIADLRQLADEIDINSKERFLNQLEELGIYKLSHLRHFKIETHLCHLMLKPYEQIRFKEALNRVKESWCPSESPNTGRDTDVVNELSSHGEQMELDLKDVTIEVISEEDIKVSAAENTVNASEDRHESREESRRKRDRERQKKRYDILKQKGREDPELVQEQQRIWRVNKSKQRARKRNQAPCKDFLKIQKRRRSCKKTMAKLEADSTTQDLPILTDLALWSSILQEKKDKKHMDNSKLSPTEETERMSNLESTQRGTNRFHFRLCSEVSVSGPICSFDVTETGSLLFCNLLKVQSIGSNQEILKVPFETSDIECPRNVAVSQTSQSIVITDRKRRTLCVYTCTQNIWNKVEFGINTEFNPGCLTWTGDDHIVIYLISKSRSSIAKYSKTGERLWIQADLIGGSVFDLALDRDGNIYCADNANDRIRCLNKHGEHLPKYIPINSKPEAIQIDSRSLIYVLHEEKVQSKWSRVITQTDRWGSIMRKILDMGSDYNFDVGLRLHTDNILYIAFGSLFKKYTKQIPYDK